MFPVYRCGIALALNKLSQWLRENQVTPIFLFFVPDALNDRHSEVRRCMLDAALSVLNTHGKVSHHPKSLLHVLLFFLSEFYISACNKLGVLVMYFKNKLKRTCCLYVAVENIPNTVYM